MVTNHPPHQSNRERPANLFSSRFCMTLHIHDEIVGSSHSASYQQTRAEQSNEVVGFKFNQCTERICMYWDCNTGQGLVGFACFFLSELACFVYFHFNPWTHTLQKEENLLTVSNTVVWLAHLRAAMRDT